MRERGHQGASFLLGVLVLAGLVATIVITWFLFVAITRLLAP